MTKYSFYVYLAVMAGVTYLIRMLPLVLVRRKIENRFLLSFLYYIPYAVLSVMTIPAIIYATEYRISAAIGFMMAMILSFFEQSLVKVAAFSCAATLAAELILRYVI